MLDSLSISITGYINEKTDEITSYFALRENNESLQEENKYLREQLANTKVENYPHDSLIEQSIDRSLKQQFNLIPVRVVNNSIVKKRNFITLNKGENSGIKKGDGVVSTNGILGLVINTSQNYSRITSILNTDIEINARVKNSEFFGTLKWDGKDARYLQLTEIPKYIEINKGDTIETDGKSVSFPEGIFIGTVEETSIDEVSGELDIKVRIKENFSRLRYGYVVSNLHKPEVINVEKPDSLIEAMSTNGN